MSFTKNYIKNILFLVALIFCIQYSKASDSLKVKKIEYFEEGRLVRAEYYDTLGRKTKEISNNFLFEQNRIKHYFYKKNKLIKVNTFNASIVEDSIVFFDKGNLGNEQIFKYINNNLKESVSIEYQVKDSTLKFPASKVYDFISKRKFPSSSYKYFLDKSGSIRKIKYRFGINIKEDTYFIYERDSLNRIVNTISKDSKGKLIKETNVVFSDSCQLIRSNFYNNGILQLISISKIFKNSKNQEIMAEQFENNSIGVKLNSALYLSMRIQKVYDNDRLIKIIYEYLQENKTKIYELKYEFYN